MEVPRGEALLCEVRRLVSVLAGEGDPEKPLNADTHLTVTEFQERVRVSRNQVYRWLNDSEQPLPAWRPPGSRQTLIRWGDWLDWRRPYRDHEAVATTAARAIVRIGR